VDRREAAAQGRYFVLTGTDLEAAGIEFRGMPDAATLGALVENGPLPSLGIDSNSIFALRHARAIAALPGVQCLRIWAPATCAAIGVVLQTPGLERLTLREICTGAALRGFESAHALDTVSVSTFGKRPGNLLAIARSPALRLCFVMDAFGTRPEELAALAAMPRLEKLSLESSDIDDSVAAALPPETRLHGLYLAANPITDAGLHAIVRASSLRELDLWETRVTIAGLALLEALPDLEYLSLGHADPAATFDPDALLPQLMRLPKLQRLELDGIVLDPRQRAAYSQRFALKLVER
jgi:hypothetical protein